MEVITAYVDRLRIYEHVLNRVEYRFNEGELDYDYYNTYMTNEIMHYILSDKDNVVINGKISEIVGQLPVRMLKDRFFEHNRNICVIYNIYDVSMIYIIHLRGLTTGILIKMNMQDLKVHLILQLRR